MKMYHKLMALVLAGLLGIGVFSAPAFADGPQETEETVTMMESAMPEESAETEDSVLEDDEVEAQETELVLLLEHRQECENEIGTA